MTTPGDTSIPSIPTQEELQQRHMKILNHEQQECVEKQKHYRDIIVRVGLEDFNKMLTPQVVQGTQLNIEIDLGVFIASHVSLKDQQYISPRYCYDLLKPIFVAKGYGTEYVLRKRGGMTHMRTYAYMRIYMAYDRDLEKQCKCIIV